MKYAPVMPPLAVRQLDRVGPEAYFCYADWAFWDEDYMQFFLDKPYVVLDCPVMEHGELLEPWQLKRVIRKLDPTVTIVPDTPFNKFLTLQQFRVYAEMLDHSSLAGVLQGTSVSELVECAVEMLDYGVAYLAIPRLSERNAGRSFARRSNIIQALAQATDTSKIKYHLLGANWPYEDEMYCAAYGLADSVDTAEPVNAAIRHQRLTRQFKTPRREGNWFDIKHVPQRYLDVNVRRFQQWLTAAKTA
jgi:hypothetical protein